MQSVIHSDAMRVPKEDVLRVIHLPHYIAAQKLGLTYYRYQNLKKLYGINDFPQVESCFSYKESIPSFRELIESMKNPFYLNYF